MLIIKKKNHQRFNPQLVLHHMIRCIIKETLGIIRRLVGCMGLFISCGILLTLSLGVGLLRSFLTCRVT